MDYELTLQGAGVSLAASKFELRELIDVTHGLRAAMFPPSLINRFRIFLRFSATARTTTVRGGFGSECSWSLVSERRRGTVALSLMAERDDVRLLQSGPPSRYISWAVSGLICGLGA